MAKLAILGHATRGSEVIALLEMLEGINSHNLYGDESYAYYTIDSDKEIKGGIYVFGDEQLCYFTLEQFEEKFSYKVGDKVIDIKTNKVVEIYKAHWSESNNCTYYDVKRPNNTGSVRSHKFLQPYKEETIEGKITINEDKGTLVTIDLTREFKKENEIEVILGDYEFVPKDGKTYFIKKNKYPKTYEECCDIVKAKVFQTGFEYKSNLISNFQKLLLCRDAYWKIAGEQMGLGKPWEPKWEIDNVKYSIMVAENKIKTIENLEIQRLLVFPAKEMRDAFFENFKDLIEKCKEFL